MLSLFEMMLNRVAYPAMAEVWRQSSETSGEKSPESATQPLSQTYYRFRLAMDAAVIGIFLAIMLLADFAFSILYTEDYGQVVYYVKLLAVLVLLLPYRLLNAALLVVGESRNFMITLIGPVIMMMGLTPIIFHLFDPRTAILFSALAYLPALPLIWWFARNHIALNWGREIVMAVIAVLAMWGMLVRG